MNRVSLARLIIYISMLVSFFVAKVFHSYESRLEPVKIILQFIIQRVQIQCISFFYENRIYYITSTSYSVKPLNLSLFIIILRLYVSKPDRNHKTTCRISRIKQNTDRRQFVRCREDILDDQPSSRVNNSLEQGKTPHTFHIHVYSELQSSISK